MSTIGVKDNRKRAAAQIKKLEISEASPLKSGNDESIRVTHKKRARTGVLPNRKQQEGKTPNHHRAQQYCVLYKKAGITEKNYRTHSSENWFVKRYNQYYIKEILGGALYNRTEAVNHNKNLNINWKRTWKPSRVRIKLYLALSKSSVQAANCRRSRPRIIRCAAILEKTVI